jgi:Ca2+/Na+ antiporter
MAPLIILDAGFFSLVDPRNSSSFMIIIGCILIGLTLYLVLRALTRLAGVFFTISDHTQRRFVIFITILLMFMLLMQSIGQLSLKDILAIVPLMIVLYLYLTYTSKTKARQS